MRTVLVATILLSVGCIDVADAASTCRGGRIYTHCSDNMAFLRGQCSAFPADSGAYAGCMADADSAVAYSCQAYRVPCSYEGSLFDALSLLQYPKVGAPTPLRPGFAPIGDQTRP